MTEIIYKPIDSVIEAKLWVNYAELLTKHPYLIPKEACFNIAAMAGDEVVGVATCSARRWTPPLDMYGDAFIEWIDVDEAYRRRGIGRMLVTMLENWARDNGYRQLRAWSNNGAVAALHMWYAMGYAMCPAVEPIFDTEGKFKEVVQGYKYAKML
jgi:GNAT superfamily N-acetyltransferase